MRRPIGRIVPAPGFGGSVYLPRRREAPVIPPAELERRPTIMVRAVERDVEVLQAQLLRRVEAPAPVVIERGRVRILTGAVDAPPFQGRAQILRRVEIPAPPVTIERGRPLIKTLQVNMPDDGTGVRYG